MSTPPKFDFSDVSWSSAGPSFRWNWDSIGPPTFEPTPPDDTPLRKITYRFYLTDRHGRRWVMEQSTTYCLGVEPDPAELRRHLTRRFKTSMLHQIDAKDLLFGSTIGELSIVEEKVDAWVQDRVNPLTPEGS